MDRSGEEGDRTEGDRQSEGRKTGAEGGTKKRSRIKLDRGLKRNETMN